MAPGNGASTIEPVSVCLDINHNQFPSHRCKGCNKPKSIHQGTFFSTDMFIVPIPHFGAERLSTASKDSETCEVVALDVVGTHVAKESDSGRCRVKMGDLVLFDSLPVAGGSRVDGGRFDDGGGDPTAQWAIDGVPEEAPIKPRNIRKKERTCDW